MRFDEEPAPEPCAPIAEAPAQPRGGHAPRAACARRGGAAELSLSARARGVRINPNPLHHTHTHRHRHLSANVQVRACPSRRAAAERGRRCAARRGCSVWQP